MALAPHPGVPAARFHNSGTHPDYLNIKINNLNIIQRHNCSLVANL